ncbi:MAG: hypothetical protein ACTSRE_16280, partial [Promethearchaeota archaeon]
LTNKQIGTIRSLFLLPNVMTKIPNLSLKYPNRGGILELMTVDHALNNDRVNKGVSRLKKAYEKTQKEKTVRKLLKIP